MTTRGRAIRIALAVAAVLACGAAPAWAHRPSDAQLRLALDGAAVTGTLDVAVRDLDEVLVLDGDGDGALTWGELTAEAPRIAAYVTARLAIASTDTGAAGAESACPLRLGAPALVDLSDGTYYSLPLTAACARRPDALAITYALLFDVDPQHRGLVHLDGQVVIVRDAAPVRVVPGEPTSIAAFVREGVWHIWIGLDHVLFLLCLILPAVFPRRGGVAGPAASLRGVAIEVLEIVTAFTLAHSITLVLAAAGLVQLPARLVETLIALSVLAAAVNNLVRVVDARWAVAFALGLLHGFGFSSVLVDLGLPSSQLIGSLLGFNLGVELGQAAIVVVALPLLYAIRRTVAYQAVLYAGSAAIAALAALWSYQRWFE